MEAKNCCLIEVKITVFKDPIATLSLLLRFDICHCPVSGQVGTAEER